MSRQCDICGKSAVLGNGRVTQRAARSQKYLGGNGRKTTGISRRQFRPNLQRIQVQEGGSAVTRRVCTQCIRSGRIAKAVVRKPFTLPTTLN